ncbi:hypothetical protein [Fischerella sp. JS2]|nr:hypothetical protein [Fischerella sp. JS2]
MSVAVANALFPEGSNTAPAGIIRVPAQWQAGVAAAPLVRWLKGRWF